MPLDATELGELIESHAATLRLWIRSRCSSAEDVVQEAFCRLATQEPRPDNPVAWLYRVCRNLAERQRLADQRRIHRERAWAEIQDSATEAGDPLEMAETLSAVDELSPELREVLVARIWGQLPLEEIARLCGVSTATAFRRYQTALEVMRTKLEAKEKTR